MTRKQNKEPRLAIRTASHVPAETAYFEPISLVYTITNISADELLVDSVTLQFEPDMDTAPNYIITTCALHLVPHTPKDIEIKITPTPVFREATNEIQIQVKYRVRSTDGLVTVEPERHKQGFFVIIRKPAPDLGEVFISFKQMEDVGLANILERYLERAGFRSHRFIQEPNLGADQWVTIENMIKACDSAIIVWTDRTGWGEGVQKEIELCRLHGVRVVPLLERGLDVPACFAPAKTYQRFDPQEPAKALSDAVGSLRKQIIEASRAK